MTICSSILIEISLATCIAGPIPSNHANELTKFLRLQGYSEDAISDLALGSEVPDFGPKMMRWHANGNSQQRPSRWEQRIDALMFGESAKSKTGQHIHAMENLYREGNGNREKLFARSELFSRTQAAYHRTQTMQRVTDHVRSNRIREARLEFGGLVHYWQDVPFHSNNLVGTGEDARRMLADQSGMPNSGPRIGSSDELINNDGEHTVFGYFRRDLVMPEERKRQAADFVRWLERDLRSELTSEEYSLFADKALGLPSAEEIESRSVQNTLTGWRERFGPDAEFQKQPDGWYRLIPKLAKGEKVCRWRRNHVVWNFGPDEAVICSESDGEMPEGTDSEEALGPFVWDSEEQRYRPVSELIGEADRDLDSVAAGIAEEMQKNARNKDPIAGPTGGLDVGKEALAAFGKLEDIKRELAKLEREIDDLDRFARDKRLDPDTRGGLEKELKRLKNRTQNALATIDKAAAEAQKEVDQIEDKSNELLEQALSTFVQQAAQTANTLIEERYRKRKQDRQPRTSGGSNRGNQDQCGQLCKAIETVNARGRGGVEASARNVEEQARRQNCDCSGGNGNKRGNRRPYRIKMRGACDGPMSFPCLGGLPSSKEDARRRDNSWMCIPYGWEGNDEDERRECRRLYPNLMK